MKRLTWLQLIGVLMLVAVFAGLFGTGWAMFGFLTTVAIFALIDLAVVFIIGGIFLIMN